MGVIRTIVFLITGYGMGIVSMCLICRRWDD